MFIDKQLGQDRKWINIDSDMIAENSYLYKKYEIDKETIEYAMDKNERAHMDYNRENGTITFIYNVLDLEKDKEYYETIPMTFIVQDTRLVTISNQDNAYIIEQMVRYLESHGELSIYKLLFAGLEMISNAYYPIIDRLDSTRMNSIVCFERQRRPRIFMPCLTLRPVWSIWSQQPSKIGCC